METEHSPSPIVSPASSVTERYQSLNTQPFRSPVPLHLLTTPPRPISRPTSVFMPTVVEQYEREKTPVAAVASERSQIPDLEAEDDDCPSPYTGSTYSLPSLDSDLNYSHFDDETISASEKGKPQAMINGNGPTEFEEKLEFEIITGSSPAYLNEKNAIKPIQCDDAISDNKSIERLCRKFITSIDNPPGDAQCNNEYKNHDFVDYEDEVVLDEYDDDGLEKYGGESVFSNQFDYDGDHEPFCEEPDGYVVREDTVSKANFDADPQTDIQSIMLKADDSVSETCGEEGDSVEDADEEESQSETACETQSGEQEDNCDNCDNCDNFVVEDCAENEEVKIVVRELKPDGSLPTSPTPSKDEAVVMDNDISPCRSCATKATSLASSGPVSHHASERLSISPFKIADDLASDDALDTPDIVFQAATESDLSSRESFSQFVTNYEALERIEKEARESAVPQPEQLDQISSDISAQFDNIALADVQLLSPNMLPLPNSAYLKPSWKSSAQAKIPSGPRVNASSSECDTDSFDSDSSPLWWRYLIYPLAAVFTSRVSRDSPSKFWTRSGSPKPETPLVEAKALPEHKLEAEIRRQKLIWNVMGVLLTGILLGGVAAGVAIYYFGKGGDPGVLSTR
ncbi:hypothetical protein V1512DRAFT_261050 [Lipomyces arxii]|uniref:uncharacterized protein n=1 Tax=Lipomyces arxii TaxID=56418 RepID=UPI0034CD7824